MNCVASTANVKSEHLAIGNDNAELRRSRLTEGAFYDDDSLIHDQSCKFIGTIDASIRVAASLNSTVEDFSKLTRPFSWGYGCTDGALGHVNTSGIEPLRLVSAFRSIGVKQVIAADRLTLFLTYRNEIYQCGRLISYDSLSTIRTPSKVNFPQNGTASIISVRAANCACYALDDLGKVYEWGCLLKATTSSQDKDTLAEGTPYGLEIGEGFCKKKSKRCMNFVNQAPAIVSSLSNIMIKKIRPGNDFVIAVDDSGNAFSWGQNRFGQLGLGHKCDTKHPEKIVASKAMFVVDVEANYNHVLAILAPRRTQGFLLYLLIYSWGKNQFGCLGREEEASSTYPQEVTFFRGLNPAQIATGIDHSMVLCLAGSQSFLYTFGGNQFGQLGTGITWQYCVQPRLVYHLAKVPIVSISAGSRYSVALSAKGELFSWGDGMYGKTSTPGGGITCVPNKISSSRNQFVTQISAGKSHVVGLFRNC